MAIKIDNNPADTVYHLLSRMDQLDDVCFYLTGSRYFDTCNPWSDYDFFTVDTVSIRNTLSELGFLLEVEEMYGDAYVTSVYRHKELPVHIQLVDQKNINSKITIQETIKFAGKGITTLFTGHSFDRTEYWKFATDLFEKGKASK